MKVLIGVDPHKATNVVAAIDEQGKVVGHMIAVCQARSDPRGRSYYRKKLAEGKSRKEAMRCLKRRVSDAVFKALTADSQRTSQEAA